MSEMIKTAFMVTQKWAAVNQSTDNVVAAGWELLRVFFVEVSQK